MQRTGIPKRALIVGAGIAGPVLALHLRRSGVSVALHEAGPEPLGQGQGFVVLSSSSVDILRKLGVLSEVLAGATSNVATVYRNHRGRTLARIEEPRLLVKRSVLVGALRREAMAREIPIEYGRVLARVDEMSEGSVLASFSDGTSVEADFLIGADGVGSRVRRLAFADAAAPVFTGLLASTSVARSRRSARADGVACVTFGREGCFGHQVLPNGQVYWFETFEEPGGEATPGALSESAWQSRLLAIHRKDPAPVSEVIAGTREPIERQAIYDLPPLATWSRGPVCLVGDAAHPVTPHFGHGAVLALEDSVVLARCVRDAETLPSAFARFEMLRRARVERAARDARRIASLGSAAHALGRGVRDLLAPVVLRMGASADEDAGNGPESTTRAA